MDLSTRSGRKEQGQRIQRAAEEAGLSLEELAREIGCSRALIYQYVSGGVLAQPGRLQKIAQRTGHTLAFFYENGAEAAGSSWPDRPELQTESSSGEERVNGAPPKQASGFRSPSRRGREGDSLEEPEHLEFTPDRTTLDAARPTLDAGSPKARRSGAPAREEQEISPDDAPGTSAQTARIALPYLEELADALESAADLTGLISACERIIPFARELGARDVEARAWLRLGNARIQGGHHELAIPALRVALSLFQAAGNTRLALSSRQSLGRARLALGDAERAMEEFRQVADGPSWENRWQGAISIAAVYEHYGEFRAAIEWCESAMEIVDGAAGVSRATVDAARSFVISNQANVYLACGDVNHTCRLSEALLLTSERANQRDQYIEGLLNLGVCQLYHGDWGMAEETLLRAADLARFLGDDSRLGLARAWRATVLALVGQWDEAKQEAKESLELGLESGCQRSEIQSQLALGDAYLHSQSAREALYHFTRACKRAVSTSAVLQESLALQRRAMAHLALNSPEAAMEDANASLALAQSRGMQHVEAMALLTTARAHLSLGEDGPAQERAANAVRLAATLGLTGVHCLAEALLAAILEGAGSVEESLARGTRAVELLNDLRARVREHRDDEALLDDPRLLEIMRSQALRLRDAGRLDEAADLVESAHWHPLSTWWEETVACDTLRALSSE